MNGPQLRAVLIYLIAGILLAIPIFGFLDSLPIQRWDESRNAVNALLMRINNDYVVSYYGPQPDHWNTKPPLLFWFQNFFFELLGPTVLAVRLPSAIATFLGAMLMLVFSHRVLKNIEVGLFSALALVTSHGFMVIHGARTGDFDALLSFFTLAAILSIYTYTCGKRALYLYLFFISIALGALTKGISIFIFGPAILIFLLVQKEFIPLLKSKHFYFGTLLCLLPIIGFYILRENQDPGYLQAVVNNELGGRFNEGIEGHEQAFNFYFLELRDRLFETWFILVPFGILAGVLKYFFNYSRLTLLLSISSISYLFIISLAATKLIWYTHPAIPLMCLLVGIFIATIYTYVKAHLQNSLALEFVFLVGFGAMVFYKPYKSILYYTNQPRMESGKEELYSSAMMLHKMMKEPCPEYRIQTLDAEYVSHITFYCLALESIGCQANQSTLDQVVPGQVILVQNRKLKTAIHNRFKTDLLRNEQEAELLKILELKN